MTQLARIIVNLIIIQTNVVSRYTVHMHAQGLDKLLLISEKKIHLIFITEIDDE